MSEKINIVKKHGFKIILLIFIVLIIIPIVSDKNNIATTGKYNTSKNYSVWKNGRHTGTKIEKSGITYILMSERDQLIINENINSICVKYPEYKSKDFIYFLASAKSNNVISMVFFIYTDSDDQPKNATDIAADLIHIFAKNNIIAQYDAIEIGLIDSKGKMYDNFGFDNVTNMIDQINKK